MNETYDQEKRRLADQQQAALAAQSTIQAREREENLAATLPLLNERADNIRVAEETMLRFEEVKAKLGALTDLTVQANEKREQWKNWLDVGETLARETVAINAQVKGLRKELGTVGDELEAGLTRLGEFHGFAGSLAENAWTGAGGMNPDLQLLPENLPRFHLGTYSTNLIDLLLQKVNRGVPPIFNKTRKRT